MKFLLSVFKLVAFLAVTNLVSAKKAGGTKTTYQSKGRGGSADMGGGRCGDWPFDNYIYVYAMESASKVKGDGSLSKTVVPYMSASFTLWMDCLAESATLIEVDWDTSSAPVPPSLNFPKDDKLEKGSADGTFAAREIPCTLVKETYEDGSEWVWYNCDYSLSNPTSVDISVDWTGTDSVYTDRSTSTGRYPGGYYKISSRGKTRTASITLDISVDGVPYDMEGGFDEITSYNYGTLTKSSFSEISKYQVQVS